jgi:DNA-binding CsgD family transcriptional regulator
MKNRNSVHPLAQLSAHHLAVLALVAENRSSKEIARELGISPDTVDQRLKRVKVLTGVSGRAEAARLYREAVASGAIDALNQSGYLVYQPQSSYSADFARWPQERSWYAGLLEARLKNDLTPLARTLCIGVMTFLALLSVAAGVSLVEGLSRLF